MAQAEGDSLQGLDGRLIRCVDVDFWLELCVQLRLSVGHLTVAGWMEVDQAEAAPVLPLSSARQQCHRRHMWLW